jgi:hypothetical protein
MSADGSRYARLLVHIFEARYTDGATSLEFTRDDIISAASDLGMELPRNLGDVVYSFRYRVELPDSIREKAPAGLHWVIRPAGRGRYRIEAVAEARIVPNEMIRATKIPDATPNIISMYSLSDEQALLAKLRYNRLLDIFTGVTCYSLQSHLRTTVTGMGQVETDEIYIGVDHRGAQYAFPVQAKGGRDVLSIVQIEQDFGMCADKFPELICHGIAAQFMEDDVIALFEFEDSDEGIALIDEKHYRLVPGDELDAEDLRRYAES